MKITYKTLEIYKDKKTYPVQSFCKEMVAMGHKGKLEIYPEGDPDGDGIPDLIYPSIVNAANHANCKYLQKGVHYAQWFPVLKKDMK